jgi:hypothetical protein
VTLVRGKGQLWWLLLVVAVALALRLYRINWQSSLYDENFSLMLADRSFARMMAGIIRDAVHPPLHYMVLWGWVRLFGFDQLQSRLVSALFGMLSVPMIFLVGRRVLNPRTGLIAATLLAVSQLAVHHSQEGRMYAMAFFLALCALFFFVRTLQDRKTKDWLLFLLFSILMLYTSYYTFSVLLACALFVFIYRQEYPIPRRWIVATTVILPLALLPWLTSGVVSAFAARVDLHTDPGFMRFEWTRPITSLNWFNSGKWNGMYIRSPGWSIPAGLLLFTAPALLGLGPVRRKFHFMREVKQAPGSGLLLVLLWIIPMLVVSLVSWSTGTQYDVRYTVYGMAGYLLLVALGLDSLGPATWRKVALGAAVAYSASSLGAIYYIQFKSDYRGTSRYVVERFQPGDCLCFMPRSKKTDIPEYWYVHGRSLLNAPLILSDRLTEGSYPCKRVWMLWDNAWFFSQKGKAKTMAEFAMNNDVGDEQKFYGLDVVLFRPR